MPKKRWKRILLRISFTLVTLITIVILFISPITKYLIEKYDVKYSGREIKMDWAYVNPFTGSVYFNDLKIYEQNSDSVFFSAKGLDVNLSMLKLLSETYEISSVTLTEPIGKIIKEKKSFNFTDLIARFASKDSIFDTTKAPVHLNILNVEIKNGTFYYIEPLIPVNYGIKNFNFTSDGKYWDSDSITGKLSFVPSVGGGDISSNFMINVSNLDYRLAFLAHKLDLSIVEQYLKDLISYGSFSANIDADLNAIGNFKFSDRISVRGDFAINEFHFGKTRQDDYASFKKLKLGINELDPGHKRYFFDSILLDLPYAKYELYDYLDNIQHMFGHDGAIVKTVDANPEKFNLIIAIANYIKLIFQNAIRSDYKVRNLYVKNGNFQYYDYSINEKFYASLNPFTIKADSIEKAKNWVRLYLESGLKPYGSVAVHISMNPKNNKDFDFTYKLQKVPVAAFNPYIITYTGFPLDRGQLEISGSWYVRDDVINSTNHFLIIDPRVSTKIKKKQTPWIPMPLIMSIVREGDNVIDYEIPITGNLKDPHFNFHDIITDLIKNILFKPPTTPYRYQVKSTENEIQKYLSITWAMRQNELLRSQRKFINKIANFLKENPSASIVVHPNNYTEKEKEYILFFEAKKKYYISSRNKKGGFISEKDSIYIEKMSLQDSSFIKYVNSIVKDPMMHTMQGKCTKLVGEALVNGKFDKLIKEREKLFIQYFIDNQTVKQVKIVSNTDIIPFNGFSTFTIKYNGEIPQSLKKANEDLSEINSESPRDKYLKFRKGRK